MGRLERCNPYLQGFLRDSSLLAGIVFQSTNPLLCPLICFQVGSCEASTQALHCCAALQCQLGYSSCHLQQGMSLLTLGQILSHPCWERSWANPLKGHSCQFYKSNTQIKL